MILWRTGSQWSRERSWEADSHISSKTKSEQHDFGVVGVYWDMFSHTKGKRSTIIKTGTRMTWWQDSKSRNLWICEILQSWKWTLWLMLLMWLDTVILMSKKTIPNGLRMCYDTLNNIQGNSRQRKKCVSRGCNKKYSLSLNSFWVI